MESQLFTNYFKKSLLTKQNFLSTVLIFLIFFTDRYSKTKIINNFSENTLYINNYINIDLVWNTGIGFGLLSSNSDIIYNLISIIIFTVIIFLIYFSIRLKNPDKYIFSIIVGGAIGNFYDRLIYKGVPDFIDLHFEKFHWFTFNLADIFISLGIFLYLIKDLFVKKKDK